MVQFIPYEDGKNDPSYLGYTKEPGAVEKSKVTSSLIEGLNDFGSLAIKAIDNVNKIKIDDELSSTIRGEKKYNTDLGLSLLDDLAKPTEAPSRTPLGSPNEFVGPIPPAIDLGVEKMAKWVQANKQGKFDDISYYGNMQQIAQNLISRYPGYSQYITEKTAHFLGTDPANAQRSAVQATLAQLAGAKDTAADKWIQEVRHDAQYLGTEKDIADAFSAVNDPAKQNAIRIQIGKAKANEHNIKLDDATLNRELTLDKVTTARMENVVNKNLGTMIGQMNDTFIWNVGGRTGNMQDLNNMIAQMQKDGNPDPEVLRGIGLAIGQMKDHFSQQADKWYAQKRYAPAQDANGNTYYTESPSSLLKDATKWASIKKTYMDMWDGIADQVGKGNLSLATTDQATIAAMTSNAGLKLFAMPIIANYSALNKELGPQAEKVINQLETISGWKDRQDIIQYVKTLSAKAITTQGASWGGFMKTVEGYKQTASGDPTMPPEPTVPYLRGTIENVKNLFVSPDMPLATRQKVAEFIAQNDTVNFINTFSAKNRADAWAAIYAPDVTVGMKTLMSDALWKKYRGVGEQAFNQVFQSQLELLNKQASADKDSNFKWNEETQQIDYNEAKTYRNRVVKTEVQRTIDQMNTALRTLGGVLAQDGEKISAQKLKDLGVNLDKSSNPATEAVLKPLREAGVLPPTGSKGSPKASPEPSQGLPATLDEYLAKYSKGQDIPMYQGDMLIKNPQEVIQGAREYKGEYFVQRDVGGEKKWFKIVLPK